jgi:hypothetical protein
MLSSYPENSWDDSHFIAGDVVPGVDRDYIVLVYRYPHWSGAPNWGVQISGVWVEGARRECSCIALETASRVGPTLVHEVMHALTKGSVLAHWVREATTFERVYSQEEMCELVGLSFLDLCSDVAAIAGAVASLEPGMADMLAPYFIHSINSEGTS